MHSDCEVTRDLEKLEMYGILLFIGILLETSLFSFITEMIKLPFSTKVSLFAWTQS